MQYIQPALFPISDIQVKGFAQPESTVDDTDTDTDIDAAADYDMQAEAA